MREVVGAREDDPRLAERVGERLRLFDRVGEELLVDRAMVDVLKRHPFARQHAVELDDPLDQVGVRLLPERFFPLAEELIQEGRHGVGERVGIEPPRAERIPGHAARHAQFEVVILAAHVGEHPADVVTQIPLHFEHDRRRAPLGIRRVPAQQLTREGVQTRGGLAGPDGPDNRRAGIEPPLRDDEPVRGGTLHQVDGVVHLADNDGRAVGGRRQRPVWKAGAEPHPAAPSGEPDAGTC